MRPNEFLQGRTNKIECLHFTCKLIRRKWDNHSLLQVSPLERRRSSWHRNVQLSSAETGSHSANKWWAASHLGEGWRGHKLNFNRWYLNTAPAGGHVRLRTAEITKTSGAVRSLSQGMSSAWRTKSSELKSLIRGQTFTSVDCLNINYILDPQVTCWAVWLLLLQLHICSLVLRNCNDLVHIDGNVPFVCLP